MHYYKRNIGDYSKKAGRLSMAQHGAYTLLIDACYDREQFPTEHEAIDWTWASSTEEVEAVKFVLSKFFTLEDGRYVQSRIQEELNDYHGKAETNARIARERETKRRESHTNRERTVNEPPPNHKPLTTNQEPEESKALVPSDDGTGDYSSEFEQFWKAYPKREGGNSKKGAFKAWKARLRAGAKADDLIMSASRYAEHMAVQGRIGTSFVKQASTFLGPDDHWQEVLTSNVHPIATARNGMRPALKPGEFYDLEWDDRNPSTHKIYHSDTHDPTTGYAWVWLKKQAWYRP